MSHFFVGRKKIRLPLCRLFEVPDPPALREGPISSAYEGARLVGLTYTLILFFRDENKLLLYRASFPYLFDIFG